MSPHTTQAISCPCSSFTTGPSPIGGVGVDVEEPGGGECELLETAHGSLQGESRVMSWCIHRYQSPGAHPPQELGLDILPADLASCHRLSVIMNYDLIPARPRAPPGHCTPRHLDRQCHRTGLRWLPLQQGTSSCYLPARRPTGSPVPPLPPLTRDERDQILGVGSRGNGEQVLRQGQLQQPQKQENPEKK